MVYSNCKQITGLQRRRTAMQGLARGSVICFGSTVDGEFCLDTLLVIARAETWVPAQADQLGVGEAFKICTGGSVASRRVDRGADPVLVDHRRPPPPSPVRRARRRGADRTASDIRNRLPASA